MLGDGEVVQEWWQFSDLGGVSHGLWIPCQPIDLGKHPPAEKGDWDSWFEASQEKLPETNPDEPDFFRTKKKCRGVFKKREMYRLYSPHRHLDAGIGCGPQYRTWIRRSEAVNDDSWSSYHLSNGSVLRPTYVRCPTKHANLIYKPGCIWMKVCQHWCKLDRGPLQAHCAWKCPVGFMEHATSMIRLSSCWLSESAQKLSHHVRMRTNNLRGLPYSEASRASLSRLEGQGLQRLWMGRQRLKR